MAEEEPLIGSPFGWGTSRFYIGKNDFAELEIRQSPNDAKFHFFFHRARGDIVKSFVLAQTERRRKVCEVTLIWKEGMGYTPRLAFAIRDISSTALEKADLPVEEGETRTVTGRVDLKDCHEEVWQLIRFLETFEGVDLPAGQHSIIGEADSQLLDLVSASSKEDVLRALTTGLDSHLTDEDLALLSGRKSALGEFEKLMEDSDYFAMARAQLGENKGSEDVWQEFFEREQWIFGYGLSLVSCEGLTGEKLETIVAGSDALGGIGKRIDALMKTRGRLNSLLFCEIKTPEARLLMQTPYRPGVFTPDKDLRGGVAQVQKTIHLVRQKATENHKTLIDTNGSPTGEEVSLVRPRGAVVVGMLSEFDEEHGINYERFASFELHRTDIHEVEVITFDELLERARFIVSKLVREDGSVDTEATQ